MGPQLSRTDKKRLDTFFIIKGQLDKHSKIFRATVNPNIPKKLFQKIASVEISLETPNQKDVYETTNFNKSTFYE